MLNHLTTFLTAILVGIAATLVSIWLARKWNLIDLPRVDLHKQHAHPTPLAGGMAIMLALAVSLLIRHDWLNSQFTGLFASALIVFLFGLWDDARRLPFWVKLIGQIVAAVVLIASGTSIHIIKLLDLAWLNYAITLFWVIGIINGCNFVDSYDHLSIGIAMTMLASLLVGSYAAGQSDLVPLIMTLLGIVLVLYFFNTSPAMTFLGDSGAQLLGLFTAGFAILFTPRDASHTVSWIAPILIAGIPIFDTTLVVFSRLRRRKHVYQAGLDHTWHRLVAMGLAGNQAVQLIHLASLILGCLALLTLELPLKYGLAVFTGSLAAGFVLILFLDARKRWQ
jgi:UDP-GlcNAc:undecaprenyl-phosphate GlcNAc-1-phosphate transferase